MFSIFRGPLFPVCLILIGAFLTYAGYKNAKEFAALSSHGKTAKAEVTKLTWKEKAGSHLDSSYSAHIRFTTEDGREIQDDMVVSAELGRAIRSQSAPSAMIVRYVPESPRTFREASQMDPSDAQYGVGRYMVLAGIAWLVLRSLFRKTNSAKKRGRLK